MADIIPIDRELISGFEPARTELGHKYSFGTVLVCAGSRYMSGAAVLATGAALRSGAGLVRVFSEEKTLDAVRYNEPCALLEPRPDKTADLLRKASDLCKKSGSVLIGSGMHSDLKDMEALTSVFLEKAQNLVLDAGAFSDRPDVQDRLKELLRARAIPAVLTPHTGEFARLTGISSRETAGRPEELATNFAEENNCIVILKSAITVIAIPDGRVYRLASPNSGFAKGGSGDVLAGLTAGFLAQGMEPYKAACSAVFIHSKAGEAAFDDIGIRAVLPSDLITYLPEGYEEAGWLR